MPHGEVGTRIRNRTTNGCGSIRTNTKRSKAKTLPKRPPTIRKLDSKRSRSKSPARAPTVFKTLSDSGIAR